MFFPARQLKKNELLFSSSPKSRERSIKFNKADRLKKQLAQFPTKPFCPFGKHPVG